LGTDNTEKRIRRKAVQERQDKAEMTSDMFFPRVPPSVTSADPCRQGSVFISIEWASIGENSEKEFEKGNKERDSRRLVGLLPMAYFP
jgi:hypothetical protein